jgi:hypothetical protein
MPSTTTPDTSDPRLRRLVAAVVDGLHPQALYLFGSRAEGCATEDSDYDLMAVLPDDAPDELLDPVRAYKLGVVANVPADIIPVSLKTFLDYRGALYSLAGYVHARGRLLYGSLPP